MAAIDLCTIAQVRGWLSLNSGLPANSAQTAIVSTSIAANINPGVQTVTPGTMTNIVVGLVLSIDSGANNELVVVTSAGPSTFTANFALAHTGSVPVQDQTDLLFARMITAASAYVLWRSGQIPLDGSAPTASPFVAPVSYTQTYDGNGNDRLLLRNTPIVAVQSLTINGATIQASTGYPNPGFVIDQTRKCLAFPNSGNGYSWGARGGYGANPYTFGNPYTFTSGTQNITVQYTAGYAATPYDLQDAVIKMVAYNYRRRDWEGMKQVAEPQAQGTTTYVMDWIYPPAVEQVLDYYTRRAVTA